LLPAGNRIGKGEISEALIFEKLGLKWLEDMAQMIDV
jgi:hypothetical protein